MEHHRVLRAHARDARVRLDAVVHLEQEGRAVRRALDVKVLVVVRLERLDPARRRAAEGRRPQRGRKRGRLGLGDRGLLRLALRLLVAAARHRRYGRSTSCAGTKFRLGGARASYKLLQRMALLSGCSQDPRCWVAVAPYGW